MGKIAFVYPGQGSQYVGMGKDIYDNLEEAKIIFDEIFSNLDIDLKDKMFFGTKENLKDTMYTQLAVASHSLVLTKLLNKKGIYPDYVAGHSLGEFSAIGGANYLNLSDVIKLIYFRAKTMKEIAKSVDGSMAAVLGMDSNKIVELLKTVDGIVEAVNFNEDKQTVISGEKKALDLASVLLKENGAKKIIMLDVSGPFHSILMKEAGEKLREEVKKYDFKFSDIKLISNTEAKIINNVDELKEEIYKQAFGPVKWIDTINKLKEEGVDTIYEIGPSQTLKGLIKKIDKELNVININTLETLKNII